ncbi:hypothetical protein DFH08DRAFT_808052 [Mycena albidolilacea]|uniref:Uncharacterized protein n=1 Tax=Mycena albidolilacea TaxID=1033008 RepID=A0AAD7A2L4_9AGAR|nr:hypothetical protein DFH08DRAFT_808052 [Mycena albidolilacea]
MAQAEMRHTTAMFDTPGLRHLGDKCSEHVIIGTCIGKEWKRINTDGWIKHSFQHFKPFINCIAAPATHHTREQGQREHRDLQHEKRGGRALWREEESVFGGGGGAVDGGRRKEGCMLEFHDAVHDAVHDDSTLILVFFSVHPEFLVIQHEFTTFKFFPGLWSWVEPPPGGLSKALCSSNTVSASHELLSGVESGVSYCCIWYILSLDLSIPKTVPKLLDQYQMMATPVSRSILTEHRKQSVFILITYVTSSQQSFFDNSPPNPEVNNQARVALNRQVAPQLYTAFKAACGVVLFCS